MPSSKGFAALSTASGYHESSVISELTSNYEIKEAEQLPSDQQVCCLKFDWSAVGSLKRSQLEAVDLGLIY